MQVVSYLATLPKKVVERTTGDRNKVLTLERFAEGVNRCGDHGKISRDSIYQPSDVAMMLGWVHENGKSAPHLTFRQEIVNRQLQAKKRVVIADSSLFVYKNIENPKYYLRYSFDGVFPTTGEYCNQIPDPDRWKAIQKDIGVSLKPWRTQGDHILICLQRDGGWSMGGGSVLTWLEKTIRIIRQVSIRPILIRPHPGDKQWPVYLKQYRLRTGYNNVHLSNVERPLLHDLQNCWAVVNHNSSPGVAAAIEGVPVFVTDPDRSQCTAVANTSLLQMENPLMPDRQQWIERLSQCHWSHDDLVSGACWAHMRKFVNP